MKHVSTLHTRTRHSYRSAANAMVLAFLQVPWDRTQHTVHATQLGHKPHGCALAVFLRQCRLPTVDARQHSHGACPELHTRLV